MDTFRYGLALVFVCIVPPLLLYWPVIHGFVRFWRRVGPRVTFLVVLTATALGALGLFQVRGYFLAVEFGTNWLVVAAGAVCLGVAGRLRAVLHRDVTNRLLAGVPELDLTGAPQPLVRTGLYARVRHPRYAQLWLVLLGYALITNYLSTYLLWLLWLPAAYVITMLEERELVARFGRAYEDYRREVPRFLPRRRHRGDDAHSHPA